MVENITLINVDIFNRFVITLFSEPYSSTKCLYITQASSLCFEAVIIRILATITEHEAPTYNGVEPHQHQHL